MNITANHLNTTPSTTRSALAMLGRRSILILATAAAIANSTQSASAAKIAPLSSGVWNGGAYSNNETGRFSHCAVSGKYKSGVSLLFSVTKSGNWTMGVSKPEWNFEPGNRYNIRFQVDRGQVLKSSARARNRQLVQISLPANSKLFSHFRYGKLLKIQTANRLFKFNLTGTEVMLGKLVRCVSHFRKAENSGSSTFGAPVGGSNPFRNAAVKEF